MKPGTFRTVNDSELYAIPVLDDPGGHRLLLSDIQPGGKTMLLDFTTVAALRNYLSVWLDTNRRAHQRPAK